MKIVTAAEMREIDRATIEERGAPSLTLMERAGRAVVAEAMERFEPESAAIVAGKGNNAGDGFVAARLLHQAGVKCRVYLLFNPRELKGDALETFRQMPGGVDRIAGVDPGNLAADLERHDVIIDAILGTGFRGMAEGRVAEAIQAMNEARAPTLAVDIPSGLSADGGPLDGPSVHAVSTVTMGLPKLGMLVQPGASRCGAIVVADLGFPADLLNSPSIQLNVHGLAEIGAFLPVRPADGHKGTFGSVLVLAGSTGLTGAAVLAARAAGRSGAGLIYCGVPPGLETIFETLLIEAVKQPLPARTPGQFDETSIERALALADEADAVALGPGLSTRPGVAEFAQEIVVRCPAPLVIDADGLNVLGPKPAALSRRTGPTVITPHPGEMARLTAQSTAEIQRDRIGAAREFARRFNTVVLLKGAQTIIADVEGETTINTSGNSGLAKGGSGDLLTGLLAGLLAQGLSPMRAACAAAFIHGLAGDLTAQSLGVRAMLPTDVLDRFGAAFQTVEKASLESQRLPNSSDASLPRVALI